MIYGKKRPRFDLYPLLGLPLRDKPNKGYKTKQPLLPLYIYIYNGRSCCFVLTGGSASDGSSAKRSAIFFLNA